MRRGEAGAAARQDFLSCFENRLGDEVRTRKEEKKGSVGEDREALNEEIRRQGDGGIGKSSWPEGHIRSAAVPPPNSLGPILQP